MIIVKNSIVSDDVADCRFGCRLECCHGACCVEGDSGAPLLEEEVPLLEAALPYALPLMTEEGRAALETQGVAVRDKDGDLGTPLIDGGPCAFLAQGSDGALCALEMAYRRSLPDSELAQLHFPKPVSCHLYPIRVEDYGEFTAVNYHRWEICCHAAEALNPAAMPLYQYLKEPLVRRFGQEWYDELIEQIDLRNKQ